jgi:inosine-uridine nucleoside N-ribohydrolase
MKALNTLTKILLALSLIMFVSPLSAAKLSSPIKPVIIDTDMGVDDVIAILYLLKRPDVEIKAITIESTGMAQCEPAFRNISGLLRLMHRENIPVACGRDTPLSGNHQMVMRLRKDSNELAGAAKLLPTTTNPVVRDADKLLITTIMQSTTPVTILAIGPLTNLAQAITKQPTIKKNIRRIYIMGGAVHVPGNLPLVDYVTQNNAAEWNIYFDPTAASIVLSANIPLSIIPLDVTNQLPITKDFYQKLEQRHNTPAAAFIFELFKRNQAVLQQAAWSFWDPLAAVLLTDQSFALWQNETIEIVLTPESRSGAMIINKKISSSMRVYTSANKTYFETLLLNTIN